MRDDQVETEGFFLVVSPVFYNMSQEKLQFPIVLTDGEDGDAMWRLIFRHNTNNSFNYCNYSLATLYLTHPICLLKCISDE